MHLCQLVSNDLIRGRLVTLHLAGPAGCGVGVPVGESEMHPAALGPVGHLFDAPAILSQVSGAAIDLGYKASRPAASLDYTWGRFEAHHGTDSSTGRRIGGFCADMEHRHGGERTIVVCTHGETGPQSAPTPCSIVKSPCRAAKYHEG